MKMNYLVLMGLGLGLTLSSVAHADASLSQVNYAEASFGCNGLTPDLGITPALNLRTSNDEVRVSGVAASEFSLVSNQIILTTQDHQTVVIGTLSSAPTCASTDADQPATGSWNVVALSQEITLNVGYEKNQYTLVVTDLSTQKEYRLSW
jgi:hypothetical protein